MISISNITPLKTELRGPRLWELLEPLSITINGMIYTAPAGFIYDGNSAPRAMWSLCAPASGAYALAGPIHDFFYSLDCPYKIPRKFADQVHMAIATNKNIQKKPAGFLRARAVYNSLRLFGSGSYQKIYSSEKLTDASRFS